MVSTSRICLLLVVALGIGTARLSAQTSVTPIDWTNAVNVTTSGSALSKSAGCNDCPDAGATGAAHLTGDGFVEFTPTAGHRLAAGLGADLTASTTGAIDYAFSFWPGGSWEIRELNAYRTDGTFVAGDSFRIVVQGTTVKYQKNGQTVYSSSTPPSFPLTLDVVVLTIGGGLTQAVSGPLDAIATTPVTSSPTAEPIPTPTPTPGVIDTSGYYSAITDREARPEPALPTLGAAGAVINDPTFGSRILRVTDGALRPGRLDRSYRSPSSSHQHAWSAKGSYFYVVSTDGTVVPFRFDSTTGAASRINPTTSGDGGLIVRSYIEPQFSYVSDNIMFVSGIDGSVRKIGTYDFSADRYSLLLDVDTVVGGLEGTYLGWIASSAGAIERIVTFFGGPSQDTHYYVMAFDRNDPSKRRIVNTRDSLVDGLPTNITLNFKIHGVSIDRSGRYVMLYTTSADISGTRKAAPTYLWDLDTNVFTEIPLAAGRSGGHDTYGYGVRVNQDCCTSTSWDAAQWQFRGLDAPFATRDLITTVLQPKEVALADHSTWHNARPDVLVPVISGLYRDDAAAPWRAWDSEIVAIQTDAPADGAKVWRFAHHRSNILSDANAAVQAFWYTPRPNVSDDGRWVIFTSNWEKSLGLDPGGDASQGHRQDVFLVRLEGQALQEPTPERQPEPEPEPQPEPEPELPPLTITTTTLPDGLLKKPYVATLTSADAQGAVAWALAAGSLPPGLSLDASTGKMSGTCRKAGSWTFTVSATDSRHTVTSVLAIIVRAK